MLDQHLKTKLFKVIFQLRGRKRPRVVSLNIVMLDITLRSCKQTAPPKFTLWPFVPICTCISRRIFTTIRKGSASPEIRHAAKGAKGLVFTPKKALRSDGESSCLGDEKRGLAFLPKRMYFRPTRFRSCPSWLGRFVVSVLLDVGSTNDGGIDDYAARRLCVS